MRCMWMRVRLCRGFHHSSLRSLANALYIEGGIRTVEIGSLMFEHTDPETGEQVSRRELLRYDRRVYPPSGLHRWS